MVMLRFTLVTSTTVYLIMTFFYSNKYVPIY